MFYQSIETIYYQDGAIRITNTHATFSAQTYALTDIASAGTRTVPSNLTPGVAVVAFGSVVLLVGLYWYPFVLGPLGLIIAALGFALMRRSQTAYAVRVWSTSGEVDVLITHDQTYSATVVGAMNTAIHQQNLRRLADSGVGARAMPLAPPAA